VLVNLLDNACRFTPRNGTIEIRAQDAFWDRRFPRMIEGHELPDRRENTSEELNAYRVEVRDSGPGVAPGDVERIFEEYVTEASSSDWCRAGLGLAICRQIVQAHHGVVFAESNGPGGVFVIVMPFAEKESCLPAAKVLTGLTQASAAT
jgi:signal transduction histidine kinase